MRFHSYLLIELRISSENHAQVRDVLRGVQRDWGRPLAIVHDLRQALITAAGEVFVGVRQFVCHYHLAADVGKDILSPHLDRLRRVLRRTKVRCKLRQLVRSLKRFATSEDNGHHVVSELLPLRSTEELRQRCTAESARGVVHALACWVLAFAQEGEGYGFPFDLPYLNFYERIVQVHQMIDAAGALNRQTRRGSLQPLYQLRQILAVVVRGEESAELRQIVADTKRDRRIFERFRKALRICPKGGKQRRNDEGAPRTLSAGRHRRVLQDLCASVGRQARAGGASARACKTVLQHVEKYWEYLFGHVLRQSGRTVIVPRTNNDEERMFRTVKRQCRRLHGRKDLSHELEAMSPAVPLVRNLSNRDYCETVYGGSKPEDIATRFSRVDPECAAALLTSWQQETSQHRIPRKLEKLENLPERLARFISVAIDQLHD
jgi:hypothetical protein